MSYMIRNETAAIEAVCTFGGCLTEAVTYYHDITFSSEQEIAVLYEMFKVTTLEGLIESDVTFALAKGSRRRRAVIGGESMFNFMAEYKSWGGVLCDVGERSEWTITGSVECDVLANYAKCVIVDDVVETSNEKQFSYSLTSTRGQDFVVEECTGSSVKIVASEERARRLIADIESNGRSIGFEKAGIGIVPLLMGIGGGVIVVVCLMVWYLRGAPKANSGVERGVYLGNDLYDGI